jgi:HSP20 family protein
MNTQTELSTREGRDVARREAETPVLIPAVDIYEDGHGITLRADLPGVSRDRLDIQVEDDTLTIAGEASIEMPEGMKPLYADVRATRYRRRFTLSRELASDKISAQMNDGVLTVTIPKREELRPRKIEVSAA